MRCNKEECPPSAIRESLLSAVKAQGSQKEITKKKTKNKKPLCLKYLEKFLVASFLCFLFFPFLLLLFFFFLLFFNSLIYQIPLTRGLLYLLSLLFEMLCPNFPLLTQLYLSSESTATS